MLIRPHSKCSSHRANGQATAFTLIELLVVVAIIAILMSILLPSLRAARESARAAACGARLRDMSTALHSYFADNSDWIPGCNTSGVAIRRTGGVGMNVPDMPVQSFDWMTPLISRNTTLQEVRAKRFKELTNVFRCPSQSTYRATLYSLTSSTDRTDFTNEPGDWSAISYLMPIAFQHYGTTYGSSGSRLVLSTVAGGTAKIYALTAPAGAAWEASHATYKPLFSQIGNPSQKIAVADGTRYLTADGLLDFDVNPDPSATGFGSFTSSGGWWCGSTEYGVKRGSKNWSGRAVTASGDWPPANGRNLELTYRHGSTRGAGLSGACTDNRGQINTMLFDGSVQRMGDKRSRNPVYWYPKGTQVYKWVDGMIDDFKNGDLIP